MTDEHQKAKSARQNRRDSATILATFFALLAATLGEFRQDTELVVATNGLFTLVIHRFWSSI
jgi:hypothetical protein